MNLPFELQSDCLKNKVYLLTGATGGIGRAVAKELAARQAEVILVGRKLKDLEKLYDEIEDANGAEPALYVKDLLTLSVEDAHDIYEHTKQLFGRLDGFIHCAGSWGTLTPIESYPEQQWLEIMHLNVNVPFLLTKHLMPLLKASAQGRVVLTESPLSYQAKAYHGPFNCSQWALRAFIKQLTLETDHTQLKVMGLNPQAVQTKLRAKIYPGLPYTGLLPEQVAPFYTALLTEWGERYQGKTLNIQDYIDIEVKEYAGAATTC